MQLDFFYHNRTPSYASMSTISGHVNAQRLKVVTESEKHKVLEGCHSAELGGGHFGRDKTLVKISERFYWLGMGNDVKEYCKTCEKCQKANW